MGFGKPEYFLLHMHKDFECVETWSSQPESMKTNQKWAANPSTRGGIATQHFKDCVNSSGMSINCAERWDLQGCTYLVGWERRNINVMFCGHLFGRHIRKRREGGRSRWSRCLSCMAHKNANDIFIVSISTLGSINSDWDVPNWEDFTCFLTEWHTHELD